MESGIGINLIQITEHKKILSILCNLFFQQYTVHKNYLDFILTFYLKIICILKPGKFSTVAL